MCTPQSYWTSLAIMDNYIYYPVSTLAMAENVFNVFNNLAPPPARNFAVPALLCPFTDCVFFILINILIMIFHSFVAPASCGTLKVQVMTATKLFSVHIHVPPQFSCCETCTSN